MLLIVLSNNPSTGGNIPGKSHKWYTVGDVFSHHPAVVHLPERVGGANATNLLFTSLECKAAYSIF